MSPSNNRQPFNPRGGEKRTLQIEATGRADAVLAKSLGVSRATVADWIQRGLVSSRGKILAKSAKLEIDQSVEVLIPDDPDPLEMKVEIVEGLEIIAQDPDFVVLNKPAGVAAHPSPGWVGPTVVGGLAGLGFDIATSGAPERQGIVHRLDVGTSGLMVVATTERAYTQLKNQFRDRVPQKIYHAVVQGLPDPLEGTIEAPIGRHPGHDWKFTVLEGGRSSITHYATIEAFGPATLIEVNLETGRTHQIRVHFSGFNHPLAGDLTYGADPTLATTLGLTRQWLHALRLSFDHPVTGEWVTFESGYPEELSFALRVLSGEVQA